MDMNQEKAFLSDEVRSSINELGDSANALYLSRHHVMVYLNDSIRQLLTFRTTNPKIDVIEYFSDYFKNVKKGTHILFREIDFVMATPHNRACFIEAIFSAYAHLIDKDEPLTLDEYKELIMLLCSDFPADFLDDCFQFLNASSPSTKTLSATFTEFIYLFQYNIYFKEFINELRKFYQSKTYQRAKKNNNNNFGNMVPAAVAAAASSDEISKDSNLDVLDQKDLIEYFESLNARKNLTFSYPPVEIFLAMRNTFSKEPKQHYSFLELNYLLSQNDKLTVIVGKLPIKDLIREKYKQMKASMQGPIFGNSQTKGAGANASVAGAAKQPKDLNVTASDNSIRESSNDSSSDSDII